ncbi:hypothetical protein PPL_02751 [Heterostelium album PN500]|uniref:Uncharacterized protein n=1 Tax=Heterostelium pallidum (strain ATCC 26659 / Pp 5 / PN500) TaxID=670386 RepID=D3B2Y6_HETP5|nr:hypothetical protein PPL_02751 [Heterostelium album PN500]EFA83684.1 hypothetical protein PPL_02751 [Heterostelium album PN500]|eukprot:XP_020435801.1 hypothetical protein PPL_02751 [Heterostelium album PN500]
MNNTNDQKDEDLKEKSLEIKKKKELLKDDLVKYKLEIESEFKKYTQEFERRKQELINLKQNIQNSRSTHSSNENNNNNNNINNNNNNNNNNNLDNLVLLKDISTINSNLLENDKQFIDNVNKIDNKHLQLIKQQKEEEEDVKEDVKEQLNKL